MPHHPNAIPLENGDPLTDQSFEVARVWITNGAGSSVWIDAGILEQPEVFGFLIADTVRHAARAYAGTHDLSEDECLQRIVDGISEELREQFNDITTLRGGKLN
jgi:hypothetical protein